MGARPHSGRFLTDFEPNADHTCILPSVEDLGKKNHGLIWQCDIDPHCRRAYRFSATRCRWHRISVLNFDWWRYVFFG